MGGNSPEGKMSETKREYAANYRKPPLHSRFKPGQSANPAGRKKGVPNFKTDVENTLHLPVQVSDAGKTKRVSTQQAALSRLKQKGLNCMPLSLREWEPRVKNAGTGPGFRPRPAEIGFVS